MTQRHRGAAGTGAGSTGAARARASAPVRDSQGDSLRAAFYAVQMMSEDAARRRFAELTDKEYLLTDEADECQMLADRLNVRLAWTHFDLRTGEWSEGRGKVD